MKQNQDVSGSDWEQSYRDHHPQAAFAIDVVDKYDEWSVATDSPKNSLFRSRVIRDIQILLTRLHYDPGQPDGINGKKTKRAITFFIVNEGLDESISDDALLRYLKYKVDARRN